MSSTLEQLIEEITFRRRREMRLTSGSKDFSAHQNTTYWTDLFVRHFLFQTDYEADRDDLLFFIRKTGLILFLTDFKFVQLIAFLGV